MLIIIFPVKMMVHYIINKMYNCYLLLFITLYWKFYNCYNIVIRKKSDHFNDTYLLE